MIKIEIRKNEKLNGIDVDSAFVSFNYDVNLVNIMREETKRAYHPETKVWEIPAKNLVNFLNKIEDHQIEIYGKITPKMKKELAYKFDYKTKPFDHQIEGFEFGLKHDKFILADEQGLGKTKQAIDIAIYKKKNKGYKHCLIIAGVNGLKWNWYNEVAIHSNETAYILGQRIKKNGHEKIVIGGNADKLDDLNNLPDNYFLITNIESIRDEKIMSKLKTLCDKKEINMIVFDEIHKCKNPTSQQGKALLKLRAETMIGMTGTPLMNSPLDLFVILKWLGYENHSFYQYKNYYCVMGGYGGYEVIGYKNMEDLREAVESIMLRRLKKDVLDLPEKTYTTEYVELGTKQRKIYEEVLEAVKNDIDKIKLNPNPLAQLIRLRQATGYTGILSTEVKESAKLDRLEELIEELAENNQKALVFSNWTDMTTPTYERLKKYNPAIITGETKDREAEKERFMNDPKCKVLIGTIGAMGTGLTLTAANTAIFLDSPWNRANKEQAEDRIHRIGTVGTVNIITIVAKDTLDEKIEEIIYKKGVMADLLVDGKVEKENIEKLINQLF